MELIHERCCGVDVHKKNVVACLITTPRRSGRARVETRTFGTMTADLLELSDWLRLANCTHVAMESTGVYWKPVYNLLEGDFEVLLVNAQHLKQVPGRKTDVRDAQWIAELLRHGLLRGSFIPPAPQRALRELTRYRATLVAERARIVQRLQKVLEEANVKLASVVRDVTGVSARAMLEGLAAEEEVDPGALAELARGRLRGKRAELEAALTGLVQVHHRFLIVEHLRHIDHLDEATERVSEEIAERLRPLEAQVELLDGIPGINRRVAEIILAEIGADMSRFPTAGHLASWAGMCPGNNESGGKRRSGKTRKGSRWLRSALTQAAHGASRTKGTYLSAQYHRLAARRGKKKAIVAVGHSLLVIAYYVLERLEPYQDLGGNYFDEREQQAIERRLVRRLEKLGYEVRLEPLSEAA